MRFAAAALTFSAVACSHDWTIVPPATDDGGVVADAGASSSSSSSTSTSSSSSGSSSSSSSGADPIKRTCPSDCQCSPAQTCSFRCEGDCTIQCPPRATCQIEATASCTVKNEDVAQDCSSGSYSCKTLPNGKEITCQKL